MQNWYKKILLREFTASMTLFPFILKIHHGDLVRSLLWHLGTKTIRLERNLFWKIWLLFYIYRIQIMKMMDIYQHTGHKNAQEFYKDFPRSDLDCLCCVTHLSKVNCFMCRNKSSSLCWHWSDVQHIFSITTPHIIHHQDIVNCQKHFIKSTLVIVVNKEINRRLDRIKLS